HLFAEGGDEDGDALLAGDGEGEVGGDGLARVGDRVALEQRGEHLEVFAHVPDGSGEVVAEHVLDDDLVRQADGEGEPAGPDGEGGAARLLGECAGVARVGGDDGGADGDLGDAAARDGEGGERVESEDVRQPGRVEPFVGGAAQFVGEQAQAVGAGVFVQQDSDPHGVSFSCPGGL